MFSFGAAQMPDKQPLLLHCSPNLPQSGFVFGGAAVGALLLTKNLVTGLLTNRLTNLLVKVHPDNVILFWPTKNCIV